MADNNFFLSGCNYRYVHFSQNCTQQEMKLQKINPLISPFMLSPPIIILTVLFLWGTVSEKLFYSILASALITTGNFIAGYFSIQSSIKKSPDSFIKIFLGVLIIRLFGMLLLVFICLKFLELNGNSFIFSILFFYVFYLIIEILSLNLNKKI